MIERATLDFCRDWSSLFENCLSIEYSKRTVHSIHHTKYRTERDAASQKVTAGEKDVLDVLTENPCVTLPEIITTKNVLGNKTYIDWLLPRLEVVKRAQYWPRAEIDKTIRIRLRQLFTFLHMLRLFWS